MTTADSANPAVAPVAGARVAPSWIGWLLPPAVALVIVMAAVLLLMTPLWMHVALPVGAHELSDLTVAELFVGPGTFSAFSADEAAHMRDVRLVLFVFLGLALVAAAFIAWAVRSRGRETRTWRAMARAGAGLAIGTVALGLFAFVAFDVAFELFHRIFFPGGNWAFPPDSLLIQLYPYAFWQLTAVALGVLLTLGGAAVWWFARSRAARL